MQILREEAEIIKSSNTMQTSAASIEMTPEMFTLLSSGIYTHKERAVVRELSCNCIDAHNMNGNEDVPFDVHLPSQLEPYFEVRDYGLGMSHDDVMSLYLSYGTSTKRDSNTQIGGFGIGSKSPFAIAQSFTVDSIFGGVQRKYSVYMENGIPQVTKLTEFPTDTKSGMIVRVAVSNDKITTFTREAGNIYAHFPVKPNLNRDIDLLYSNLPVLTKVEGEYIAYGGRASGESMTVGIVMGNIEYPTKLKDLVGDISNLIPAVIERLVSHISLYVPIGSVQITASREALQLNDSTRALAAKSFKEIGERFIKDMQKQVDECQSYYDLAVLWEKLCDGQRDLSGLAYLKTALNFKGKTVKAIFEELSKCRHIQAVNPDGEPVVNASGTPVMVPNAQAIKRIGGRAFDSNKTRYESSTTNDEGYYNLFSGPMKPSTINTNAFIIADRFNKNGTEKTVGASQIFKAIVSAHCNATQCSTYNLALSVFTSQVHLDETLKLHHLPVDELKIYKMSDYEQYYTPRAVVRGNVKVLCSENGRHPTEVSINLGDMEEPQYYLKAIGHEVETKGYRSDVSTTTQKLSAILGQAVFVFRKTVWGKIPEDWIELTPEQASTELTGYDWLEYNRYILSRDCSRYESFRNMNAILNMDFAGRKVKDGFGYRSEKSLFTVFTPDNFDAINEFVGRPAYALAPAAYSHHYNQCRLALLEEVISTREPLQQRINTVKKRIKNAVKKDIARVTTKYPLLPHISWSNTGIKFVASVYGWTLRDVTDKEVEDLF
ncbi:rIIA lysis inhibitor [Yersinia phage vB_YenM_P778]